MYRRTARADGMTVKCRRKTMSSTAMASGTSVDSARIAVTSQ